MKAEQPSRRTFTLQVITLFALGAQSHSAISQQNEPVDVLPMGKWISYRQAQYTGSPLRIHLRTGYERAVVMPEPVSLQSPTFTLPGCDLIIENDVLAFYPTITFTRRAIKFVGQNSGVVYDLSIRASHSGIRQPLQINRP